MNPSNTPDDAAVQIPCTAAFRLDGETFRCSLPLEHVYLDSSDHETRVYWTDEIVGRRHRPHLTAE